MHRQQRIQIQKPCKAMNERKQCQIWIDVGENHRKIFIHHQDLAKLWPCCKTNKVKKRRSIPIERWEVKKQHEMLNQHDPNAKPNFLNHQQNELRSSILHNIHQNQNFKKSFCLFFSLPTTKSGIEIQKNPENKNKQRSTKQRL